MRIPFESSVTGTFGLSLELQVVDPRTWELAPRGAEIVSNLLLSRTALRRVRSGARQDFIEIVSSEHEHPVGLLAQMQEIKQAVVEAAAVSALCISGGASHPISSSALGQHPMADINVISRPDGLTGSPESFYGMKIHIGVRSGDEAVRLIHRLTSFIPHLIALSASSPFVGGVDSGWASARLRAAQSHAGQVTFPRAIRDWEDYERYLASLVEPDWASADDLPWDLRLRPDLGAVEISVMDSPLTLERACELAGFVQALAQWVVSQDNAPGIDPATHEINRYHACRAALDAPYVTPDGKRVSLRQDVLQLLGCILPVADEIGSLEQIGALANQIQAAPMDIDWLRLQAHGQKELVELVQSAVWRFDQTQLPGEIDSDRWALPADRLQTDMSLGAMFANRSSPGMSVADFNRQL